MNPKLFIFSIIAFVVFLISSCERKSEKKIQTRKSTNISVFESENISSKKKEAQSINFPLNQLFKKYQSAVFMVFTSDGKQNYQGTGFFISTDGIAISTYHVFEGTTKGLEIIKTIDGQELKLERVLAQSSKNDFIIFKVRLNNRVQFTPIPIANKIPEIGEDVFAIVNPHGLEHTLFKSIISGYRKNNNLIQTNTKITHGSSGGPLLNMKGEAVGITLAGLGKTNLNFAVNINVLNMYPSGHEHLVPEK